METLAPIAVFASRRPSHLRNLIDSLLTNPESERSRLIIYLGGPRDISFHSQFLETIKVAKDVRGFKDIDIRIYEEERFGGKLIRKGVDEILSTSDEVIVLEDDLLVRGDFLRYMNTALHRFENSDNVYQISGWNFRKISFFNKSGTYLFPFTTSWGWGTWKRAWKTSEDVNVYEDFEWLTDNWLKVHRFNYNENYNALSILERVIDNGLDAYDVEWYLNCFRNSKLILYPNSSLVINRGFDGSGLNFTSKMNWNQTFESDPVSHFRFPLKEKESFRKGTFIRGKARWHREIRGLDVLRFQLYRYRRKIHQHKRYYKQGYYKFF